ncbi:MAG: hypothetical protein GY833_12820 [Aestuariibacter sp.]|nr:hypothetical protein [Aestuariibacter sp.]|tara:strand:- start:137514 stop:137930 length:417 start_codon:yes stop_codon:yes gene_type:complete
MSTSKLTWLAFAGTLFSATLLSGCIESEVKYVDVSTGKPVLVEKLTPVYTAKSNPKAPVPHTRSPSRYITRDDGSVVYIDKSGAPQFSGLERICIDGIVYIRGTHVLTPYMTVDKGNHPFLEENDSGSAIKLKGVTCN